MRRLSSLREELERSTALEQRVRDTLELSELGDEGLSEELATETAAL